MANPFALLALIKGGEALVRGSRQRRQTATGAEALDDYYSALLAEGPPSPALDQAYAGAQAVQKTQGGSAGLDFLLAQTDPALAQTQDVARARLAGAQEQALAGRGQRQAREAAFAPGGTLEGLLAPGEAAGLSPTDFSRLLAAETGVAPAGGAGDPAAVREYQFFASLPKEQQDRYLALKRSQQLVGLGGGAEGRLDPLTGQVSPVTTPEQVGAGAGTAAVTETGIVKQDEARRALPETLLPIDNMMDILDQMEANPGGFKATFGVRTPDALVIPGSETANFRALLDRLGGATFLQAYEGLKGGGQITEIESDQAKKAITTLLDPNISEKEARKEMARLREINRKARKRAYERAGLKQTGLTGRPQEPGTQRPTRRTFTREGGLQ